MPASGPHWPRASHHPASAVRQRPAKRPRSPRRPAPGPKRLRVEPRRGERGVGVDGTGSGRPSHAEARDPTKVCAIVMLCRDTAAARDFAMRVQAELYRAGVRAGIAFLQGRDLARLRSETEASRSAGISLLLMADDRDVQEQTLGVRSLLTRRPDIGSCLIRDVVGMARDTLRVPAPPRDPLRRRDMGMRQDRRGERPRDGQPDVADHRRRPAPRPRAPLALDPREAKAAALAAARAISARHGRDAVPPVGRFEGARTGGRRQRDRPRGPPRQPSVPGIADGINGSDLDGLLDILGGNMNSVPARSSPRMPRSRVPRPRRLPVVPPPPQADPARIPCPDFQTGSCRRGSMCRFLHEMPKQPAVETDQAASASTSAAAPAPAAPAPAAPAAGASG